MSYTVVLQGSISDSDRPDQKNIDPINEIMNVTQHIKEVVKRQLEKVTSILRKNINLVKKYALLANPKGDDNDEDEDEDALDQFF